MASLAILALPLVLAGCASPDTRCVDSIDRIATVPRGCTRAETQKRLGKTGVFQFELLDGSDRYQAVEIMYSRDNGNAREWARFLCIFKNGHLYRIVSEKNWREIAATQPATPRDADLFDLAKAAIASSELSELQIRSAVQRGPGSKQGENWGPFIAVMTPVLLPGAIGDAIERDKIERQYDPDRLKLGMSPSQVDHILGAPLEFRQMPAGRETRRYAESPNLTRVVVVFRKQQAIGIFADGFALNY